MGKIMINILDGYFDLCGIFYRPFEAYSGST